MHPLVSGPEAKRYQMPDSSTYLFFPYEPDNGKIRLLTVKEMESRFPKAWLHLLHYEKVLRYREGGYRLYKLTSEEIRMVEQG